MGLSNTRGASRARLLDGTEGHLLDTQGCTFFFLGAQERPPPLLPSSPSLTPLSDRLLLSS